MTIVDSQENPGKNTIIFFYDTPGDDEDAILINGLLMKQKEKWVSLSSIKGREAIRLCRVPEMEFRRDPSETVEQALDPDMERYQRPTDPVRRAEILGFFNQNENYIVNSSIVWLPSMGEEVNGNLNGLTGYKDKWDIGPQVDGTLPLEEQHQHPASRGNRTYRIQTEAYGANNDDRNIILQQICQEPRLDEDGEPRLDEYGEQECCGYEGHDGSWFDVCPEPKCPWNGRPGHLIDGQHRTRGVAASANPEERIPVNVMEGDSFDEGERSKIFSEVNNNQLGLDDLHRLNLAFRTESAVYVGYNYNFNMQAQRKSYQVAARLTEGKPSDIMKERIHLLPPQPRQQRRRGRMLDAKDFVRWSATRDPNYSRNWFGNGGPWRKATAPTQELSTNEAAKSLSNFYNALAEVFGSPLWETATSNNGGIQQVWIVQSIFKMYPRVVSKIREGGDINTPTKAHFKQVLDYLQNIDFTQESWRQFGSGQNVSGQNAFNHRTKILRALVDGFAPGGAEIPATINEWIGSAPQFGNLTSTENANISALGTTLGWESIVDAVHHPKQESDDPPLLSDSGEATISISATADPDSELYTATESSMSHVIDHNVVEDANLTPGDDIIILVSYQNINGQRCEESVTVKW